MKKIKAWAVANDGKITAWGCTCASKEGSWRYPIFYQRRDAQKFAEKNQMNDVTIKVVSCTITFKTDK